MKRIFKSFVTAAMAMVLAAGVYSCEKPNNGDNGETPGGEVEPPAPEKKENVFIVNETETPVGSTAIAKMGDYLIFCATPFKDITGYEAIFEQEEFFYFAISPVLNGVEFDPKTEGRLYTIISTIKGAEIETLAPELTDEITAGKCLYEYKDGITTIDLTLTLANGTEFYVNSSVEGEVEINDNSIARNDEEKPIRAGFYMEDSGYVYLYLTHSEVYNLEELMSIAEWCGYIIMTEDDMNGNEIDLATTDKMVMVGILDNANFDAGWAAQSGIGDSDLSGTISVSRSASDPTQFAVNANVKYGDKTLRIKFDGNCKDALEQEVKNNEFTIDGTTKEINSVIVDNTDDNVWHVYLTSTGGAETVDEASNGVKISLFSKDFNGEPVGFSMDDTYCVTYKDQVFNAANGSSGTITAYIEGETLTMDFTNYNGFTLHYSGPFIKVK